MKSKKVFTMLLAFAVVAATALPALAEETTGEPVVVVADGETKSESTGSVSVTADGVSEDGIPWGVVANAYNEGQAEVKVTGDIDVKAGNSGDEYLQGITIYVDSKAGAKAEVSGDVRVSSNSGATGFSGFAYEEDTEISISVGGDVSAKGDEMAVGGNLDAHASGAKATSSVEGDVLVISNGFGAGEIIDALGEDARASAFVGGNVSVEASEDATGVFANAALGSETAVTVGGDVKVNAPEGDGVSASAYDGGNTLVEIGGDVHGPYGLSIYSSNGTTKDKSSIDVVIEGTLSGDIAPVSFPNFYANGEAVYYGEEGQPCDVSLTVWKIVPNEDGQIVAFDSEGKSEEEIERANKAIAAFEQDILYIIKLNQPGEGGTLSLDGTVDSHGFAAAKMGDTVTLKAAIQNGYRLVGAFNNGVALTVMDKDGNYYIIVPSGGGVELSVLLEKIAAQGFFAAAPAERKLIDECNGTGENAEAKISFYTDGSVVVTRPEKEDVSGKYAFVDDELTFSEIDLEATTDEDGTMHVLFTEEDGNEIEFVLTAEFVENIREAVEG